MLIQTTPPLHLTYCMNIHSGESLDDVRCAIETHVVNVRGRVWPRKPFGLGLRLGRRACDDLERERSLGEFRAFLEAHDLYVFTINGFPYGSFHGTRVKEQVYAPDWRDPARLEYTTKLARILANLLPSGIAGSISTVPCSFRSWICNESDVKAMVANLVACAEEVARICEQSGCDIVVALEPEPACWLETTHEAIRFFHDCLPEWTRTYLGLCLDTCHMAVQFEDPVTSLEAVIQAGLRIGKIQLSAAVEAHNADTLYRLRDEVYLHQTKWRRADGTEKFMADLPTGRLAMLPGDKARVHYHVPLYAEGGSGWVGSSHELSDHFFALIREGVTQHVEIETYTFNLVPAEWRETDVDESIAKEILWALSRLKTPG